MKSKIKYILLTAVLLILIAFVIAGFLTDWFGLYGPVSKIAIAGAKTFGAQNFSADFKFDTGKFYAEGTLQLSIDPDSEIVEANIELVSGKTTYIAAIYDRKLIYGTKKHLFSKDIQQEIESYFERQKNSNVKIRSIDDALDLVFDLVPADLKDLISGEKSFEREPSKQILRLLAKRKEIQSVDENTDSHTLLSSAIEATEETTRTGTINQQAQNIKTAERGISPKDKTIVE